MDLISKKLGVIENLFGTLGFEIGELKKLYGQQPKTVDRMARKKKKSNPGIDADMMINRFKAYDKMTNK